MTPQSKKLLDLINSRRKQPHPVNAFPEIMDELTLWINEVDARLEHFDIREKARFNADTTPGIKSYMGAPEFVGKIPPVNHEHSNIEFHTEEMRRMLAARIKAGEFKFRGENGGRLCSLIKETATDISSGIFDHDPKLLEGLILYIAGACLELLDINHQRKSEALTKSWTGGQ